MRILLVHSKYRSVSGEHVVVARQAGLLRDAGHDVEELYFQNPHSTARAATMLVRAPWNTAAASAVRDAVDRFSPDVVHLHNTWFSASPAVSAALNDLRIPTIVTLHNYRLSCVKGTMFRDGKSCEECRNGAVMPAIRNSCYHGSLPKTAVAVATQLVDRRHRDSPSRWYVAPSEYVADVAVDAGVRPDRCRVIPHFAPDGGARSTAASESDTVLFVGRLDKGKGVTRLLSDWPGRASPYYLELLGDGPDLAAVRQSLPAHAHSLGWRPTEETGQRMRTSRALVFPSEWQEPFGLVLVEALSAGLPVIGLDVSAVRHILGSAGDLIHAVDDRNWLSDGLDRLGDDAFVDDLSRRSRARFEEEFRAETHLSRLESLYREALRGEA